MPSKCAEETIERYANQDVPVLADAKGRVVLDEVVAYFRSFHEERRSAGLLVEKNNGIFAKGGYSDKEARNKILANPFRRFEDMHMLRRSKTLGLLQVDEAVWKHLTVEEKAEIVQLCDRKLAAYYERV